LCSIHTLIMLTVIDLLPLINKAVYSRHLLVSAYITEFDSTDEMKLEDEVQRRFSLNMFYFYLLKSPKRIRDRLNKLIKFSHTCNNLQHYLIEHACV
jgi:hypothetical protein